MLCCVHEDEPIALLSSPKEIFYQAKNGRLKKKAQVDDDGQTIIFSAWIVAMGEKM